MRTRHDKAEHTSATRRRVPVGGARCLGALVSLTLATACVPPPSASPPVGPASPPSARTPPAQPDDAVFAVLAAAERALAEDRLLTPPDDNAYMHFAKALELAPHLPEAQAGKERIVERYIALAHRAIGRESWRSARVMLERARQVDSRHPGIAPLWRQVQLLANAERLTLDLAHRAVRERHPAAAAKLAAFGSQARRRNARVTIRAGSDADARWMHEQLRKAPGTGRVRGGIEIGVPPRVTILLFAAGEG